MTAKLTPTGINLLKECQSANEDSVEFVTKVLPDAPCGISIPRTDILTVKSSGDENESNVPINKNYLAAHSSLFNVLFNENGQADRDTAEGCSVNIDPPATVEHFNKMIDVLHLGDYVLNDENVENVLRLANQFLLEEVEGKCKRYLTSEHCKIPTIKKFQIAEKYGLDALGEYILNHKIQKSDFDGKFFMDNLHLMRKLSGQANQAIAIRHRQLFPPAQTDDESAEKRQRV
uniref:BTB domain-containing protein n=1 Tax=Globodera pallida TaxID=36090 RepID=A0A183CPH7_GLOPA